MSNDQENLFIHALIHALARWLSFLKCHPMQQKIARLEVWVLVRHTPGLWVPTPVYVEVGVGAHVGGNPNWCFSYIIVSLPLSLPLSFSLPPTLKNRLKNKIKKQDPIIHIYWDCQLSMIQKWKIEIFTHVSLKSKRNKIKTSTQTMLVILGNSLCFSKSQFPHF